MMWCLKIDTKWSDLSVDQPTTSLVSHHRRVISYFRILVFLYLCISVFPYCPSLGVQLLNKQQRSKMIGYNLVESSEGEVNLRSSALSLFHQSIFSYFCISVFPHSRTARTVVKVGLPSLAKELCPSLPISLVVYSWRIYGRAFCCARKCIGSAVAMS